MACFGLSARAGKDFSRARVSPRTTLRSNGRGARRTGGLFQWADFEIFESGIAIAPAVEGDAGELLLRVGKFELEFLIDEDLRVFLVLYDADCMPFSCGVAGYVGCNFLEFIAVLP